MKYVLLACSYNGAPLESDKLVRSKKVKLLLKKDLQKIFIPVSNRFKIVKLIIFSKNIKSIIC